MVITSSLSRVFTAVNSNPNSNTQVMHRMPMFNVITNNLSNFFGDYNQIRKKKTLMAWAKAQPELTAFLNKVSNDVTSRWHFEPIKPGDRNRNKIMNANRFAQEVVLGQTMNSQAFDVLATGDGFGWLGFLKDDDVRKEIVKSINKLNLELKEKHDMFENVYSSTWTDKKQVETGFNNLIGIDEDLRRPRKYLSVPSSTVEIKHDEFDIFEYVQIVGMKHIKFNPKEMVHYTFAKRDGKPNGFNSVESILIQLELLRLMWQNQLSIYKNGGVPDYVIVGKDINPNSLSYKHVVEQLKKYKLAANKHGNLVLTGDWNFEALQQLDSMQFKDQGLYITGLVAMQWGIPKSSIPFIIGGTNTKDDTGGNSERGYWEVVRGFQKSFQETMNTQLWIPHFGVQIIFDNPFINLDIQIETARMNKFQNIITMDDILMKSKKQLTLQKRLELLQLSSEGIEEVKEDPMMMMQQNATGIGTSSQLSPNDVNSSAQRDGVRRSKRDEQSNVAASRGTAPTGVSKEKEKEKQLVLHEFKNREQIVPFDSFVKFFNEDQAYHPGKPPRILRRKMGDLTTMEFSSSDFDYRTIIKNEDDGNNRVLMMNLSGNISDV